MTTQKGEREEALIARLRKEAAWQADYYAGAPCSEILSESADTIERLLSPSKAEGEMREALKLAELFIEESVWSYRGDNVLADIRAALSPKKDGT